MTALRVVAPPSRRTQPAFPASPSAPFPLTPPYSPLQSPPNRVNLEEISKLEALSNGLLRLAQYQQGIAEPRWKTVQFPGIVSDAVARVQLAAETARIANRGVSGMFPRGLPIGSRLRFGLQTWRARSIFEFQTSDGAICGSAVYVFWFGAARVADRGKTDPLCQE